MNAARKRLASALSDFEGEDEVGPPVRPRAIIRRCPGLPESMPPSPAKVLSDSSPGEDPDCVLAIHVDALDPERKLTFGELCEALESHYEVYRNHPNPEEWKRNLDVLLGTGQYTDEASDFEPSQTSTLRSESNEATSSPGNRSCASSRSYSVSSTCYGTPLASPNAQHLRSDDSYEEFFYRAAETPDRESDDTSDGCTQENASDNESDRDTDTPKNTEVNSESPPSTRYPSHFEDEEGFRTPSPPEFAPSPISYDSLDHSQTASDETDAVLSPLFPQENQLYGFFEHSLASGGTSCVPTRAPTPAGITSDDEASPSSKNFDDQLKGRKPRRPSSDDFPNRSPPADFNMTTWSKVPCTPTRRRLQDSPSVSPSPMTLGLEAVPLTGVVEGTLLGIEVHLLR